VTLHIYYDTSTVSAPTGQITTPSSGATLLENPTVTFDASASAGIKQVDLVAWYDGYDENGDGIGLDWHESRFVENLSLARTDFSVRLYGPDDFPPGFGMRTGSIKERSLNIPIPAAIDLSQLAEVGLHYRTWNGWDGYHEPWQLNALTHLNDGKNHHYDYDIFDLFPSVLRAGDNTFTIRSDTKEHALEVLAPGPALTLRTRLTPRPTRLTNLSARTHTGIGDERLILGFVLAGPGTHSILSRAIGPGLQEFGVTGVLADPTLSVLQVNETVASNDNWNDAPEATTLAATAAQLGAFALTSPSLDAAALVAIPSASYTLHVVDAGAATGIALAEIYDNNGLGADDAQRMVNLSVRARVQGGDGTLIAGFVITGDSPLRVLLRGIGPSLIPFGISDAIANPRITLFNTSGAIASNDDWNNDPAILSAASQVGAFALNQAQDAALVTSLPPGAYTLQVLANANDEGVALVEIYELP
jgi:hypothetical protein